MIIMICKCLKVAPGEHTKLISILLQPTKSSTISSWYYCYVKIRCGDDKPEENKNYTLKMNLNMSTKEGRLARKIIYLQRSKY